jgi:hypothetical protein
MDFKTRNTWGLAQHFIGAIQWDRMSVFHRAKQRAVIPRSKESNQRKNGTFRTSFQNGRTADPFMTRSASHQLGGPSSYNPLTRFRNAKEACVLYSTFEVGMILVVLIIVFP